MSRMNVNNNPNDETVLVGSSASVRSVIPGSKVFPCSECDGDVLIAPSGQEAVEANPSIRIMCMACFAESMMKQDTKPEVSFVKSDKARQEILDYLTGR